MSKGDCGRMHGCGAALNLVCLLGSPPFPDSPGLLLATKSTCRMHTLQVLLFHRDVCEAVEEEALIELCDW